MTEATKKRTGGSKRYDDVADQLREEVQQTRDEYNKLRGEMGERAADVAGADERDLLAGHDHHAFRILVCAHRRRDFEARDKDAASA